MTDALLLLLMSAVWVGNMNTTDIQGVRLASGLMSIFCAVAGIAFAFMGPSS